jgi:hypothetical protein
VGFWFAFPGMVRQRAPNHSLSLRESGPVSALGTQRTRLKARLAEGDKFFAFPFPALTCWATFCRPCGTKALTIFVLTKFLTGMILGQGARG